MGSMWDSTHEVKWYSTQSTMTIREILLKAIEDSGLSERKICKEAKVDPGTFNNWINTHSRDMGIEKVARMVRRLGVSLDLRETDAVPDPPAKRRGKDLGRVEPAPTKDLVGQPVRKRKRADRTK